MVFFNNFFSSTLDVNRFLLLKSLYMATQLLLENKTLNHFLWGKKIDAQCSVDFKKPV